MINIIIEGLKVTMTELNRVARNLDAYSSSVEDQVIALQILIDKQLVGFK